MAENETQNDIERLIKSELNLIVFKKKEIANDYLVYNTGLPEEKSLIVQYLSQDKVKKYVLTQCLILDATCDSFAEKAKFNADENKCEVVKSSMEYFLNNLYLHKGKLLSEAIKDQLLFSFREFIDNNNLESSIKADSKNSKIDKLQKIGTDIYFLVEKIYPEYSVDCRHGVKEL